MENINPLDHSAALISSLTGWAKQPFSFDMDLAHWALFTGLILVLAILWKMVLMDMKDLLPN